MTVGRDAATGGVCWIKALACVAVGSGVCDLLHCGRKEVSKWPARVDPITAANYDTMASTWPPATAVAKFSGRVENYDLELPRIHDRRLIHGGEAKPRDAANPRWHFACVNTLAHGDEILKRVS